MSKLRARIDAIERQRPTTISDERLKMKQDMEALFDELRRWEREVNDLLPIGRITGRRSWHRPTPDLFDRLSTEQQALLRLLLVTWGSF